MVERSGSRRQLCNSERLQGGQAAKYVQFQKELRGTGSARKAVWTSICSRHSVRVVGRFHWLWPKARASSLRNEAVRAARDKERGDGSHGVLCRLQLVDTEGKERAWAAWAACDRPVLFIKTANNTLNLSLPKSTCDY